MRVAQAAVLAATLFAFAGCGGEEQAATGGGAEVVPASAPVFISIDSDLSSSQWQTVDDLLDNFPGRSQLLAEIRSTLRGSGFDYERDVKPALGEEIDVVWLDFESGGENIVGITEPKDEAAFRRMVEKGNREDTSGDDLELGEFRGWTVIADSQVKIERFRDAAAQSGETLADDDIFKDALAELPDAAVVKAYAKGESLTRLFQRALQDFQGTGGGSLGLPTGQQQLEFIAAALAAEGDGLRLSGAARGATEPKTKATNFSSKLIEDVPADAVAFLTFRGKDSFAQQARSSPTYRRSLRQFQLLLGVPLDKLLEIFEDEVALFVRPASPFPEITLLVNVESDEPAEEDAFRGVDQLMKALTRAGTGRPCGPPTVEDGVTVTCVRFGLVTIRYAGFDEKLVVTTGQSPVAELRGGGTKLPDAEEFNGAQEAASMPDETAGFLWIDVARAVPILLGFAQAAEEQVPPQVRANLEPLKSLLVWADAEGRTSSFSAFVEID